MKHMIFPKSMNGFKLGPQVLLSCFIIGAFIAFFPDDSFCSDEVMEEIKALRQRIEQLEKKLAEQDSKLEQQESKITQQEARLAASTSDIEEIKEIKDAIGNLEFSVGATSVVQGTINNDRNFRKVPGIDGKGDDADASYSINIEISSKIGANGLALLHLEAGEGEGLNSEAGGLSGVNADAFDEDDVEVSEVWYEHRFFKDRLVATVGKIDVTRWFDVNAVANDETTQFLADIFVNNIAVELPDYSYGGRVSWYPHEQFELSLGYAEADGDFEDLFDDNFYIAEIGFKPVWAGLQGNYRLYVWRNSGEHEKLRDRRRRDKSGEGFGLSFDQQFSEHVSAFCRFGQQSGDIYEVRRSWSLGMQVAGDLWGRSADMLGIAFGRAETSGAYRDVLRGDGFGTTPAETRLEAYYRLQVNDHLAISPDLQWVDGLAGSSNADNVTILGIRAQLDF